MSAIVIIACVIFNKITSKLGIPMLFAFILLGMFFGSDGVVKIPFDNYVVAEQIATISLIFIMFYGGFGTNWSAAKPQAVKAGLLSSAGTVITALLVGAFGAFILHLPLTESFLIGAVISSTDAASVFSILRSRRLNLRDGTASLLEVESGSNDPAAFMLTIVILSIMQGGVSVGNILLMLVSQLFIGAFFGVICAFVAYQFFTRFKFCSAGFDAIFMVAVALISFALPTALGGNGYLSAYITGIILGNCKISNKVSMVNFFDGTTGLLQMLLFFILGLLSFPSALPSIAPSALLIALFLTFVARPLAVFAILSPFGCSLRQMVLVSWAGMRGAASIVFAILALTSSATITTDIFHIIFFIVLFSILIQGSLVPYFAKKLSMVDENADVMKTFTDYTDEVPIQFLQFELSKSHPWCGKTLSEIILPPESIIVLVIRENEKIIPNGQTELLPEDKIILSGKASEKVEGIHLYEKVVSEGDEYEGKPLSALSGDGALIIMIRRGKRLIIPRGRTVLHSGDILVINHSNS